MKGIYDIRRLPQNPGDAEAGAENTETTVHKHRTFHKAQSSASEEETNDTCIGVYEMSITTVTEKEQQLAQALTAANKLRGNAVKRINDLERQLHEAANTTLERAAVVCATEWATAEERKHGRTLAAEIRAMKEEV